MALTTPAFCSLTDIDNYLSAAGVAAFSDHDENGVADTDVVEQCINRGRGRILDYAGQIYSEADLATSQTVKDWNIVLATYFLCGLRGCPRPDSLVEDYQEVAGKDGFLEQVRAGSYKIYGLAERAGKAPSFSNLRIDRRFAHRQVRVEPNSSVPQSTPQQDKTLDRGVYDY